jgi:SAM-dependent MidA family methyltransferase
MTARHAALPIPAEAARAASNALQQLIAAEITDNQAPISFARYMELALYSPGLGYYSGGATKLGPDGDFTTAPEITPLFGQTLAQVATQLFPPSDGAPPEPHSGLSILEIGAGSGQLAHDFLGECRRIGLPVQQYAILELSGSLRARQQAMLHEFPEVCWLEQWPTRFSGLVLGNEVLDAMPVHLVQKQLDGWQEMQVGWDGQQFGWHSAPCSAALLAQIEAQIPDAAQLAPGYLSEIHPVAHGFIQSLAALLDGPAAVILLDYGFPAHEYYSPQRHQGTLYCHYRHHAHPDPFFLPGLQDITAHVDFSMVAGSASAAGLDVLGYSSQAAFLLDAGILNLLARTDPADAAHYLPQANALQRLLSPAEMGELFKVLVLGRDCALPACFLRNNRMDRL